MNKPEHHINSDANFTLYLKKASEEVQSWPIWKQTALGIGNSSYTLKHTKTNDGHQKKGETK